MATITRSLEPCLVAVRANCSLKSSSWQLRAASARTSQQLHGKPGRQLRWRREANMQREVYKTLATETRLLRSDMKLLAEEVAKLRRCLESSSAKTPVDVQEPTAPRSTASQQLVTTAAAPGKAAAVPSVTSPRLEEVLQQQLVGKTFAWCHAGDHKTGIISFEAFGRTGQMAPSWSLTRWRTAGPHEVILEGESGENAHHLFFNARRTGFFCEESGQRGFLEGCGFASADAAGAPKSADAAGLDIKTDSINRYSIVPSMVSHQRQHNRRHDGVERMLQDLADQIMAKRLLP